jgi:hypothetical protein
MRELASFVLGLGLQIQWHVKPALRPYVVHFGCEAG